jgi:hypothetical protein
MHRRKHAKVQNAMTQAQMPLTPSADRCLPAFPFRSCSLDNPNPCRWGRWGDVIAGAKTCGRGQHGMGQKQETSPTRKTSRGTMTII